MIYIIYISHNYFLVHLQIAEFMFKPNKHFGPNDGGQHYHWDGHGVGASSATANRPVDKADFARVNEGYM